MPVHQSHFTEQYDRWLLYMELMCDVVSTLEKLAHSLLVVLVQSP
jgi:hypothetical protein